MVNTETPDERGDGRMPDREKRGVGSCVAQLGGAPSLFINGAPFPAAAYMTYLTEYGDYAAFARAGYRLFSLPVLFAGRWINAAVDNPPFHLGIFDKKEARFIPAFVFSAKRNTWPKK